MQSSKSIEVTKLQVQAALWGSILWVVFFQILQYTNQHGYKGISSALAGFIMGYMTAFAGHLLWKSVIGKYSKLFGETVIWRIILFIPVSMIFLIGGMGLYLEINGTTPWSYNIAFIISGFIVSKSVIPVIQHLDSKKFDSKSKE